MTVVRGVEPVRQIDNSVSSGHADEQKEDAVREPVVKKIRRRALCEVDVAVALSTLLPRLLCLRGEMEQLVEVFAETDYPDKVIHASLMAKQADMMAVGAKIIALPVCCCCFVEVPGYRARVRGVEKWLGRTLWKCFSRDFSVRGISCWLVGWLAAA